MGMPKQITDKPVVSVSGTTFNVALPPLRLERATEIMRRIEGEEAATMPEWGRELLAP